MLCKKGVLKNFTRKHLCQSLPLIKLQVEACNFIKKKDSGTGVFLWTLRNFSEQLSYRTPLYDCFWMWKSIHRCKHAAIQVLEQLSRCLVWFHISSRTAVNFSKSVQKVHGLNIECINLTWDLLEYHLTFFRSFAVQKTSIDTSVLRSPSQLLY